MAEKSYALVISSGWDARLIFFEDSSSLNKYIIRDELYGNNLLKLKKYKDETEEQFLQRATKEEDQRTPDDDDIDVVFNGDEEI